MGKQTAANVIFISHISVKSCAYGITTILPFDSHYAIFHLCEFLLVPKCAYLEDPLYSKVQPMMVHSTLLFFKLGIGFCGLMSMFLSLYFRRKIMCRLALGRGLRSLSPPYCGLPNKHLDNFSGVEK